MKNVWNKLSMFVRGVGESYRSSPLGRLQNYAQSGGLLEDAAGKFFGSNLTGAEREANEFTRNERLEAQQWTAEREDTYYQRTMADMEKAGINPMMAASGSAGTSPSSGGQSVSPQAGSLSDLLQLATLGPQISLMKSQANANNASADEKRERAKYWPQRVEESKQKIALMKDQSAKYLASAMLDKATEENMKEMRPYLQALYTSQRANFDEMTETERHKQNELDQKATLEAVQAAYQQGLIDEGMCKEVVGKIVAEKDLASSQASKADIERGISELALAMRTGAFNDVYVKLTKEFGWKTDLASEIVAGFRNAFDMLPISVNVGS